MGCDNIFGSEIDNIKAKNETYVLAGDLNRHLGSYIPGNNPKVSTAGKLLIEFLEDEENILVNSTGMRNISKFFWNTFPWYFATISKLF